MKNDYIFPSIEFVNIRSKDIMTLSVTDRQGAAMGEKSFNDLINGSDF